MENNNVVSAGQGPFFDELVLGQVFGDAPALTLTDGLAATHRAILGYRLALALDQPLCREVTGGGPVAPSALVWDVEIGQSSVVTRHVKANLAYRGLAFRRFPLICDTLRTRTQVVGLRQNRPRPGRTATGIAALRITTTDQQDRIVLDFWRCAMLPLRDLGAQTGHCDDLDQIGHDFEPQFATVVDGWRFERFARQSGGPRPGDLQPGQQLAVSGGDVASSAPELARLTLNIAAVHHDATATGGERLVYGGHTIGLAMAQATRVLPSMVTVVGWRGCDHLGLVHEGDTLRSTVTVEQVDDLPGGGRLAHLRSIVRADGPSVRDVLDWRYVAVRA